MSQLTLDLSKITAREMSPYLVRMSSGQIGWVVELAPRIVTACPWGKVDELETYTQFAMFSEEIGQLWENFQLAIQEIKEAITVASFDLSKIKAAEFDQLVVKISGSDVDSIAKMLSQYVKHCPEVGDVQSEAGYLDLAYYSQFRPLANRLAKAGQEQLENFLKRHTVR